jgi:hypothetical protein
VLQKNPPQPSATPPKEENPKHGILIVNRRFAAYSMKSILSEATLNSKKSYVSMWFKKNIANFMSISVLLSAKKPSREENPKNDILIVNR